MKTICGLLMAILFPVVTACSQPSIEETAVSKIEAYRHQQISDNLIAIRAVSGRGGGLKALEWRQTVNNDSQALVKKMNALVGSGLLKSANNHDSTTYSLTPKGWGLLTGSMRFYIGKYRVSHIKNISPIEFEALQSEELYLAEAVLKAVDIQDWIDAPGIKANFPEINKLLEDKVERYILFKGPNDKDNWQKVGKHIVEQLKKNPQLHRQRLPLISLHDPEFMYEGRVGELIRRAEKAKAPTDEEIIAKIKAKMSRYAEPEWAEIISYRRHEIDTYPFTRISFKLVSDSTDGLGQRAYCSGDFQFDWAERDLRAGASSCKDFKEDPLKPTRIAHEAKQATINIRTVKSPSVDRKDKSWRERFIDNDSDIPQEAFKAFYFDERKAGEIKFSELVTFPSIHYSRGDFHGIPAEHIGAYYIGRFVFDEEETLNINLFQGNAESAIYVDGKKLWQGDTYSRTKKYIFTPGTHVIEIQYVSDYSSAGFLVTMTPFKAERDKQAVAEMFKSGGEFDIWYCGTYESKNFDGTIDITLKENEKPVVLFLSSYEPVIWNFTRVDGKLKAVILNSKHPRSKAINLPKDVDLIYMHGLQWIYKFDQSSSDKSNTFKNLVLDIQAMLNRKPIGFSGKYGLTDVSVPEIILDANRYRSMGLNPESKSNTGLQKRTKLDSVFE